MNIRTQTGDECGPIVIELLADADTATWLQRHGKDPRAGYVVATPVTYRYVRPIRGHFPPTLLRRSWQERLHAWWRRRHPLVQFALSLLGFLAAYVAICLLLWSVQVVLS